MFTDTQKTFILGELLEAIGDAEKAIRVYNLAHRHEQYLSTLDNKELTLELSGLVAYIMSN